jgi:hypothetical protein
MVHSPAVGSIGQDEVCGFEHFALRERLPTPEAPQETTEENVPGRRSRF